MEDKNKWESSPSSDSASESSASGHLKVAQETSMCGSLIRVVGHYQSGKVLKRSQLQKVHDMSGTVFYQPGDMQGSCAWSSPPWDGFLSWCLPVIDIGRGYSRV